MPGGSAAWCRPQGRSSRASLRDTVQGSSIDTAGRWVRLEMMAGAKEWVGIVAVAALGCGPGHPLVSAAPGGGGAPPEDGGAVAVQLVDVLGAVASCGPGSEHPNICCRGGGCVAHPGAPFAACDADSLTFPDRAHCCPLDAAGACVAVAPGSSPDAATVSLPSHQCALPCGPEGIPATPSLGFAVCSSSLDSEPCEYCCSGQGCTSNVCHCPELGPDGGVCDCNAPTCGTCPAGWQPAPSQVDLCCRAGGRECFSQSAEVLDRSGGGGRSSGPGACDLYAYKDGHVYDAACDESATPPCRCTLDDATTKTFASFDQGCDFGACGFPPWP